MLQNPRSAILVTLAPERGVLMPAPRQTFFVESQELPVYHSRVMLAHSITALGSPGHAPKSPQLLSAGVRFV